MIQKFLFLFMLFLSIALGGCVPEPPRCSDNLCKVFKQYPRWYRAAERSEKKWGVPIATQMSVIYQESSFNGAARPKRRKILWVIPWKRATSAYGYSQALHNTWMQYERSIGHSANRSSFAAASDFIGWYTNLMKQRLGIDSTNAYQVYLAYHEGITGFRQQSFKHKPWLIPIAHKVQARSIRYQQQLNTCQKSLRRRRWIFF